MYIKIKESLLRSSQFVNDRVRLGIGIQPVVFYPEFCIVKYFGDLTELQKLYKLEIVNALSDPSW